jgi:hypothetical protein
MSRKSRKSSPSTKQRGQNNDHRQGDDREAAELDKIEATLRTLRADAIEWLKFAETKNAGLFVGTVTGIGIIITYLTTAQNISTALQLSLQVAAILLGWSMLLTLFSFAPRLNLVNVLKSSHKAPTANDNLEYYGHIAKYTPEQLTQAIAREYFPEINYPSADNKQHKHIAAQVIANARIALYKYRMFTMAIRGVLVALVGAIMTYLIYIVWF